MDIQEIYQENIENAADKYYETSLAKKFPTTDKDFVEADIKHAFKEGANFILSNFSKINEIITKNEDENLRRRVCII